MLHVGVLYATEISRAKRSAKILASISAVVPYGEWRQDGCCQVDVACHGVTGRQPFFRRFSTVIPVLRQGLCLGVRGGCERLVVPLSSIVGLVVDLDADITGL